MKGRLVAWIIILFIGLPLLFCSGAMLIMYLAPGFEIFGIRYVANGTCDFSDTKSFTISRGDIIIECEDVPVIIDYSTITNAQVSFREKFIGFTASKAKQPSLNIATDQSGNVKIVTEEITKFLFETKLDNAKFLKISLPYTSRNITVKAKNSPVTFEGNIAQAGKVNIATAGEVKINNSMTIGTLTINTNSNVEVGENVKLSNATITTKNKYIKIAPAVSGDLNLTTTSGNIEINSCNNLQATTSSGVIKSINDKKITVSGKAELSSKSGSITIGKILGSKETSTVTTKSGTIDIDYVNDISINSSRGPVNIGQAKNVDIEGGSGTINITTVAGKVDINARNGAVNLGKDGSGSVNNPTVTTTTGRITVYNTLGTVNLTSNNAAIFVRNTKGVGASEFKLSAGKGLTCENLEGAVEAYANGETNMHFQNISKDIRVSVGTKCKVVNIDATCKLYDEVNYELKSTKNKEASVYAGNLLIAKKNPIVSKNLVAAPFISVTGAYQVTTLYLKAED